MSQSSTKKPMSSREKTLFVIAAVAVIAVIVGVVFYFVNAVPAGAAAKYSGGYVYEDEVTEYVETYRTNYSLTDDEDFAEFLDNQGLTAAQFRERAINEIITRKLVEKRADELGLSVSDDEVDAYFNAVKGENGQDDDSMWESVLEAAGLTEDDLKDRYRYVLLQDKVLQNDVTQRDATDEEILSYIETNLAGTTQMHVLHIIIDGDGAEAKAQECYAALAAAKNAGTLDASSFSQIAQQYSTEEDVATTGGELGWTGSGVMSDDLLEALSDEDDDSIGVGTLTGIITRTDLDGTYEIAYIDQTFEFPDDYSEITTVTQLQMPDGLLNTVATATENSLWQSDCTAYLSNLVNNAEIVYYAMPSDVSYNV